MWLKQRLCRRMETAKFQAANESVLYYTLYMLAIIFDPQPATSHRLVDGNAQIFTFSFIKILKIR